MGKTDEAGDADSLAPEERLEIDMTSFPAVPVAASVASAASDFPENHADDCDSLPHLPPAQGDPNTKAVLEELLEFHVTGKAPARGGERHTPALLFPYLNLSCIRHDYPLCIGADDAVEPLTAIIDKALAANEGADAVDSGEQLRRHAQNIEAQMRALAAADSGKTLLELWDAAATVLTASQASEEKKRRLRQDLDKLRAAITMDGPLLDCEQDTAPRLFRAIARQQWQHRCHSWSAELATLTGQLEDILRVDSNRSPSPEQLRSSTGNVSADEMDFEAMSNLLGESNLGDPLPDARRDRISEALKALRLVQPLFSETPPADGPIDPRALVHDCASALDQVRSRASVLAGFFRAVRIARIEAANGYREDVHDQYFKHFEASHLTDEELALCPPVLVVLNQRKLTPEDVGQLMSTLTSGVPVKVLLVADDLLAGNDTPAAPSMVTRVASMATTIGHAFVMQCTVSDVPVLESGIRDGYDYPGPALFCVYQGTASEHCHLPLYLSASAAAESRAFPTFRFDPGRGPTWAQRMDIAGNPQSETTWPTGTLAYCGEDNTEKTVELPFTHADFLACDARLHDHFYLVSPDKWHENMIPVHEYMALSPGDADRKVPYVTVITGAASGRAAVCRAAVSRHILASLEQSAAFWRSLQELGGVNNSFALGVIAAEKDRLEQAKQREVQELEDRYKADLEKDIGALTQEIVARIAAELMFQSGSETLGVLPASAAPVVTPAAPPAPATEKTEESEDDDLSVSLDDPYIDTPLCTSCNDCFKINALLFAYDDNKQAYITDPTVGTYRDLVMAAEICPVHIIHPGRPKNSDEPGLDELMARAVPFN